VIHVVVGILYNPQGEVLVAERAQHKFQGGRWEFPGGKVELAEEPVEALRRELREEIGIEVIDAKPWRQFKHTYPDKIILLDIWHVTEFLNEPQSKEGQDIKWVSLEVLPLLEIPDANWDIIKMLME
jgi:8-oxo-dGTP diphosphatase